MIDLMQREIELLKGQIEMWKEYEFKARMETLSLLDQIAKLKNIIIELSIDLNYKSEVNTDKL